MAETKAFTYMVECADGSYYTGWTNDLAARLAAHNAGTGARYTRSRGPVRLVYWEEYDDPHQARRRECEIKKLDRRRKEALVASGVEKPQ
jgi:Predicted endonuclease containing a URI domain